MVLDIQNITLQIFAKIFDIKQEELNLSDKKEDIPSWDSISHLLLIMKLETVFNVKFKTDEVIEIDSIQKCIEIVESSVNSK